MDDGAVAAPDAVPAAADTAPVAPAAPRWEDRPLAEPWWPEGWGPAPGWVVDASRDVRGLTLPSAPSGWRGVGASRRGRLHAHRGAAREDALELAQLGPLLVAVVADGAGSKPLSRIGAAVACRAVVAALAPDHAWDSAESLRTAVAGALHAASDTLVGLAADHGVPASDLRSTLLVGGIASTPAGAWLVAAQIGDGTVAVEHADGQVEVLMSADSGEFAGEVSHFVPDAGAAAHGAARVVVRPLGDARALLICSDGVDDCFFPVPRLGPLLLAQLRQGVTEGAPGFTQRPGGPVLRADAPSDALAAWLTYEKRGENDDRTLAVLWRDDA